MEMCIEPQNLCFQKTKSRFITDGMEGITLDNTRNNM